VPEEEPDFVADEEQAGAAEKIRMMRSAAQGQIKNQFEQQFKKRVVQAAWKRFAAWFVATVLPWLGGALMILLVIFMVVVLTLYLKCQMVGSAGIFKPVLGWFGITCENSGGAATTNTAPAATQ
jgi:hypothetical protein